MFSLFCLSSEITTMVSSKPRSRYINTLIVPRYFCYIFLIFFFFWNMPFPFVQRFRHTMRTVQGSLIISSFVNIIIGYGQAWGNLIRWHKINIAEYLEADGSCNIFENIYLFLQCRIFSPIIVVPVVTLTGLGLFVRGFPLGTVPSLNTISF